MFIKSKNTITAKIFLSIAFIILFAYSLTLLLPLYYMVANSLKTNYDYYMQTWSLPKKLFYFENYKTAFKMTSYGVSLYQMIINSVILTFSATFIGIAAVTVTAYTLARYQFFGKNFLVGVAMAALLIPDLGTTAVIYKLFIDLNMIDTWFILVKYAGPFGFAFLIMYGFFKTVSTSYAEAARIDGASEFRIFIQIFLPMAKGAIGVVAVMSAINTWNDFYTPYMFLPSVKTLALGLQELAVQAATYSNYTELYAAMMISTLPLIVTFVSMHDTIINNAVTGGLKG